MIKGLKTGPLKKRDCGVRDLVTRAKQVSYAYARLVREAGVVFFIVAVVVAAKSIGKSTTTHPHVCFFFANTRASFINSPGVVENTYDFPSPLLLLLACSLLRSEKFKGKSGKRRSEGMYFHLFLILWHSSPVYKISINFSREKKKKRKRDQSPSGGWIKRNSLINLNRHSDPIWKRFNKKEIGSFSRSTTTPFFFLNHTVLTVYSPKKKQQKLWQIYH